MYKYMLDAAALYHPRENAISHDILPSLEAGQFLFGLMIIRGCDC